MRPQRSTLTRVGALRMPEVVRVLVVEDEPVTAEAHAAYVGRVDGFEVAGVAQHPDRLVPRMGDARDPCGHHGRR